MKKNCCIYNLALHYRKEIFLRMKNDLGFYFVFGNKDLNSDKINSIDLNEFEGDYTIAENKKFIKMPMYYQKGVLPFLFKDFDSYLILGELYCVSTWIFLLLSKFFPKKKIYFWTHGWYGREGLFKTLVKKVFHKLAAGVFTYGNYARDLMIKEGFDEKKLFVIHNSLSYSEQLEIRKNLAPSNIYKEHFQNDFPTLIFTGRLTKSKNLDMILDAMTNLDKNEIHTNLVLVGEGGEKDFLIKKAKELGLEKRLWLYGSCYDEKILAELIYNAELCVSPGNVGLTAIHAMSYGCPVITHNAFQFQGPEFEAVIENKTGLFFKYSDIKSLSDTIETWLKKSPSKEIVRKNCFAEVDESWNPDYQIKVLKEGMML